MSEELEALGGGDARVGEAAVFCRVAAAADRSEESVVTCEGEGRHVYVRDPRCPEDTPEEQAVRRYRVSEGGAVDAEDDAATDVLFEGLGCDALDWVLSGFNAAIIAHGESGSGKTQAMFGTGSTPPPSSEQSNLCALLLERLFNIAAVPSSGLTLGLSCFEVRQSGVVDLLARGSGGDERHDDSAPHSFVVVQAPSLPEAMQLLGVSRSRSVNWGPAAMGATTHTALPGRASAFVRVVLHDAVRGSLSSLYLIDLVGSAPLGGGPSAALNAERKS